MKTLELNTAAALLNYERGTGRFTWKARPPHFFTTVRDCQAWNTRFAGAEAGAVKSNGYRYIRILGEDYLAHRVAWLFISGAWPTKEVDHINRRRDDNSSVNLREVTGLENHQNMSVYSSNSSGVPGVSWCNTVNRWKARITVKKNRLSLGYHDNKEDAIAARLAAERKYKD
jgi:hypothetical protein